MSFIVSLHTYLYTTGTAIMNHLYTYKPLRSMLYLVMFTLLDMKQVLYIYKLVYVQTCL